MKLFLFAAAVVLGPLLALSAWTDTSPAEASTPICIPACDRCHVCTQIIIQGDPKPHPPACFKRVPTPTGCP